VAAAGELRIGTIDALAVIKADRPPPALEPCRSHAGYGQGGIRPKDQKPSAAVSGFIHLLLWQGRALKAEYVIILQSGSNHLSIAPSCENGCQPPLGLPMGTALVKEYIMHPLWGKLAVIFHLSGTPSQFIVII
jgi:hypothetical protein